MSKPIWFTVVGDFQAISIAHSEDPNALVPVTGTVTFTPMLANGDVIRATTALPRPTGLIPLPVSGILDDEGRVRLRRPTDPARDGEVGVRLMADSPLLELKTPLFYRVSFNGINCGGVAGSITPFVFQAPDTDGAIVNLIEVMRVPGQTAVGALTAGPPGEAGPPGPPGPPGQGEFDPATLVDLVDPDDDTGVVVVDNGAVKLSAWSAFKARVIAWVEAAKLTLTDPTIGSVITSPPPDGAGAMALRFQTVITNPRGTGVHVQPTVSQSAGDDSGYTAFRVTAEKQSNGNGPNLLMNLLYRNEGVLNSVFTVSETGRVATNGDVSINSLGGGRFLQAGVPVLTESGVQSVTNKTISGLTNTITDLPLTSMPAAVSRRVISSALDGGSVPVWMKVATFESTTPTSNATVLLSCTGSNNGHPNGPDCAIIKVSVTRGGYAGNPAQAPLPILVVSFLGLKSSNEILGDSFKLVAPSTLEPDGSLKVELWARKYRNGGRFTFYELSRASNGANTRITYNEQVEWQEQEPTGAFQSTVVGGLPAKRVAVPASSTAPGSVGDWAANNTHLFVYTGDGTTHTWRRTATETW